MERKLQTDCWACSTDWKAVLNTGLLNQERDVEKTNISNIVCESLEWIVVFKRKSNYRIGKILIFKQIRHCLDQLNMSCCGCKVYCRKYSVAGFPYIPLYLSREGDWSGLDKELLNRSCLYDNTAIWIVSHSLHTEYLINHRWSRQEWLFIYSWMHLYW